MREYFLFGRTGATVRVSKTVTGALRINLPSGPADFDTAQLIKALGELQDYLKKHGTK